ncbi:putative glutamine amidotransferase [bioreactor metagenome]|uniref:Putative glutamine amidotransferase n=1 Tax=bioreactor metagenome TaxID=1076179 RepID=A0A644TLW3_9ZZZZ|nr:gamma-glutamyl-gamma-aminobutyrate hydrolase family protein [Negativicutes bacterium]
MRKPVIGITANVLTLDNGAERAAISTDYVKAVELAGGVPILLPVVTDTTVIFQQVKLIDGLILSGGYDIDPLLFGEQPADKLGYISPERDHHEIQLVKAASDEKMPILGICRGIQLMNIAFGGTIYQDLTDVPKVIKHMQNAKKHVPTHTVELVEDSILGNFFGSSIVVNSFHHQAVKNVAPGFVIAAWTADGVIEAIENPTSDFFAGVQWHPEMMIESQPLMMDFFKRFIVAAQ